MRRDVQLSEPGSTLWRVTGDDGKIHYEVKCGVHKLVPYDDEDKAIAHYHRWAPEVHHDRMTFGDH